MLNTTLKPNSARGKVAVARQLADTLNVPLRTHRMCKTNATLAIAVLLNRRKLDWHQNNDGAIVVRMGGAR